MNNNQDDDETLTPEEKQFADELDLKITEAQQKLDKIGLTQSRLDWLEKTMKKKQQENTMTPEEKQEKFQEMADKAIDIPTIDRQGRKIFTLEETINNYNNAWGVLKYRELPICWSNLKEKIKFSVPMAFMAAYAYEAIQLKKMNISLFDMKYRLLGRTWGLFMIFGTTFCTLDSILFDDFCDINSYHYQTRDRKKLIRELRSQLINKPTKNEGEN